ncbi:MAG: hypothetical protein NVS9B15_04710 [Acidobacteriaceae bacterium]
MDNTVGIKLPEEALVALDVLLEASDENNRYEGSIAEELQSNPRISPYLVTGSSSASVAKVYDILRHLKKAGLYRQISAHPHVWQILPLSQAIQRPEPVHLEMRDRAVKVYETFIEKIGYENIYKGKMSEFIENNGLDIYFCDENGYFDAALLRQTIGWLHTRNALFPISRTQTLVYNHPDKWDGKKMNKPPRRRTDVTKQAPLGPIDPARITGMSPPMLPTYQLPTPEPAQPSVAAALAAEESEEADLRAAYNLVSDNGAFVELAAAVATKFWDRYDRLVQQVGVLFAENEDLRAHIKELENRAAPVARPDPVIEDSRRRAAELLKRLSPR